MKRTLSMLLSILLLLYLIPVGFAAEVVADLPEEFYYRENGYNSIKQVFYGKDFTFQAQGDNLAYSWYISFDNGYTWTDTGCAEATFSPTVTKEEFFRRGFFHIKAIAENEQGIVAESTVCKCMTVPMITENLPASLLCDAAKPIEIQGNEYYSVNASLKAVGCSELSYKWYYTDTSDLASPYKIIENQETDTLTEALIPTSAVLMGTVVFCEITDTAGNTVTSAYSRVEYVKPPKISIPKSFDITPEMITEGEFKFRINFTSAADMSVFDNICWYAKAGEGDWELLPGSEATLFATIGDEALAEGVSIMCEARAFSTTLSRSNTCEFILHPYFKHAPVGTFPALGEEGTFAAKPYTTLECEYKWLVSDDNLHWFEISDGEEYADSLTPTLRIKQVSKDNLYLYYRCIATRGNETAISPSAQLTKPDVKIVAQPTDQQAAIGKTAVFSVEATGIDLTYEWDYFNPATNSWSPVFSNTAFTVAGVETKTLILRVNTQRAYELMYRCKISDGNSTVLTDSVSLAEIQSDDPTFDPDPQEPVFFTLGDVDQNGILSAADARLALRGSVGLEAFASGSSQFQAADWNCDGKLTAADARSILRKSVGLA